MFSVEWLGQKVALKASNGKYVCTKRNGQLLAVSDVVGEVTVIEKKMALSDASGLSLHLTIVLPSGHLGQNIVFNKIQI